MNSVDYASIWLWALSKVLHFKQLYVWTFKKTFRRKKKNAFFLRPDINSHGLCKICCSLLGANKCKAKLFLKLFVWEFFVGFCRVWSQGNGLFCLGQVCMFVLINPYKDSNCISFFIRYRDPCRILMYLYILTNCITELDQKLVLCDFSALVL